MRLRNSLIALLTLVAILSLSCASSTEAQRSASRSADERLPRLAHKYREAFD